MNKQYFGNVYKDKQRKTYYFMIELGRDENGKRKQLKRGGFKTSKEAKEALKVKITELESKRVINESDDTLINYMHNYLESKKRNIEETSYSLYEMYIRTHIEPYFTVIKLKDVTPKLMDSFCLHLLEDKKLHSSYAREVVLFMNKGFKRAVYPLKYINDNPIDGIDIPKKDTKTFDIWNKDQINHFIKEGSNAKTRKREIKTNYCYYVASAISLLTGMRRGEVLGLRWEDIDFQNKTIKIVQTLNSMGKIRQGAKTKTSLRTIHISNTLVNLLNEQKRIQSENKIKYTQRASNDLVVTTKFGTHIDPRQMLRAFKDITEALELPIIRFHDLRHSHATLLLQEGIGVKVISDRLGHNNISTTLDIYSHVLPSMQQEVADKLDEIF